MPDPAPTSVSGTTNRPWWETRRFVALLILISAVPLFYPAIPPMVDLMGHMGRYRVELDLANSPSLQQYYGFHWAAIGNLGVDILVIPLAKIFGLELAVKLIVLAIPPLTIAGFLWVAREVHGRIPPTALFALPFAYSHPFMYGFVNFALSIALAFLAFGLWLRLARLGRLKHRAVLFVPISLIVFFTHTFGWGVLGLLCFSGEAVRQHDSGKGWFRSGINAALQASVMALPLLFMLAWRSSIHGGHTGHWFDFNSKFLFFLSVLRDRWMLFDIASLFVCLMLIFEAWRLKFLTFSRNLAFSALVLLAGFVLLPYLVFSSAYADMRLISYVLAVALLGIRFRDEIPPKIASGLAFAGLAFFIIRMGGNTVSLALAANDQEAKLAALDYVPMGARVVSLVGDNCSNKWRLPRNSHLGAMVIVRRHGFSNEQWKVAGANLMDTYYPAAGKFEADPSQLIGGRCSVDGWRNVDQAVMKIPPGTIDFLWLIDAPAPTTMRGADLVWSIPGSSLYRLTPSPNGTRAITLSRP